MERIMFEYLVLAILTIVAVYYFYKKTFVSGGCDCGNKNCKKQ